MCNNLCSFRCVEDILDCLGAQCPWLHSMSWQLCARCDLCVGVDEDPNGCSWHRVHSCPHPDCAHFIPLASEPLRCDKTYKLNSLLAVDKLKPWVKVRENSPINQWNLSCTIWAMKLFGLAFGCVSITPRWPSSLYVYTSPKPLPVVTRLNNLSITSYFWLEVCF